MNVQFISKAKRIFFALALLGAAACTKVSSVPRTGATTIAPTATQTPTHGTGAVLKASAGSLYVGNVASPVVLSGSASGGTPPYTYTWSFGDGATGTGQTTSHQYASPGTFGVSVTVRDSAGNSATGTSSAQLLTGAVELGGATTSSNSEVPDFHGANLFAHGYYQEFARNVRGDAVDPYSATVIPALSDVNLHVDFPDPSYGMPNNVIADNQATANVDVTGACNESDIAGCTGTIPFPTSPAIEGVTSGTVPACPAQSDQHLLIQLRNETSGMIDSLWEGYGACSPDNGSTWDFGSLSLFNLAAGLPRPPDWTSSDAAGLPVFPLLVRYDEVAHGAINHALRVTMDPYRYVTVLRNRYQYPARHAVLVGDDDKGIPMGGRLRLSDAWYQANAAHYTGQARVILDALYYYGFIVADVTGGGQFFFQGVGDDRWDMTTHSSPPYSSVMDLQTVPGSAFEMLEVRPQATLTVSATTIRLGQSVTFTLTWNPSTIGYADQNYNETSYSYEDGTICPNSIQPCSVTMTPAAPAQQFIYTPTTTGTHTLTFDQSGNYWLPFPTTTITVQ